MQRPGTTLPILLLVVGLAAGCGGGNGSPDRDATDIHAEDVGTDGISDPAPEPDAAADPTLDPEPDPEPEAPADVPAEWPTDLPSDWPVETSSACAAAGGFCTEYHWDMCPVGYEPTAPDQVLGCSGKCCIMAPYSTCTAAPRGKCIVAESCSGCWSDGPSGLTCESGRICCEWTCE